MIKAILLTGVFALNQIPESTWHNRLNYAETVGVDVAAQKAITDFRLYCEHGADRYFFRFTIPDFWLRQNVSYGHAYFYPPRSAYNQIIEVQINQQTGIVSGLIDRAVFDRFAKWEYTYWEFVPGEYPPKFSFTIAHDGIAEFAETWRAECSK